MDQFAIVSKAKIDQGTKNEYVGAEEAFNFENFELYILDSRQNFLQLCEKIRSLQQVSLNIRFSVWRILLGQFRVDSYDEEKRAAIQQGRNAYKELQEKFKPKAEPAKAKEVFNPLAKNQQKSPWNGFFEDNELKNDIKKDVDRTYQDKVFFSNLKIKSMLANILFLYCKKNSDVSYRQGMNEIIASFMLSYFKEAIYVKNHEQDLTVSKRSLDNAKFMLDLTYAEADIYTLFNAMMEQGQLEMFRPNMGDKKKEEYNLNSKKQQAILIRIARIQDNYLKLVDFELFKHLKLLNVEFQVFLIRWIRCVHTREYHLDDSFLIWDCIFLEFFQSPSTENNFFLIDCICLAMMQYVRQQCNNIILANFEFPFHFQVLEKEDQIECLQRFLKYPPVENLKPIIDVAFKIKDIILKGITDSKSQPLQNLLGKDESNDDQEEEIEEVKEIKQQTKKGSQNLALFSSDYSTKQDQATEKQKESQANKLLQGKTQKENEISSNEVEKGTSQQKKNNKQVLQLSDEDDDEEDNSKISTNSKSNNEILTSTLSSNKQNNLEKRESSNQQERTKNFNSKNNEKQKQEEDNEDDDENSLDDDDDEDSNKQESRGQNPFSSASTQESGSKKETTLVIDSVSFRSSEVSNILRRLTSSIDSINQQYQRDMSDDNLRKVVEDLQYIEREFKKKVPQKESMAPQKAPQPIKVGFKVAQQSKNKPILFTN